MDRKYIYHNGGYHNENDASFSVCIQNRVLDWETNKRSAL